MFRYFTGKEDNGKQDVLIKKMSFTVHRFWKDYLFGYCEILVLEEKKNASEKAAKMSQKVRKQSSYSFECSVLCCSNSPCPPFDTDHLRIELTTTGASHEMTRVEESLTFSPSSSHVIFSPYALSPLQ